MNCPKCKKNMEEVYSPQGVLIDACPACAGVWFDRNEISFFVKEPKRLHQEITAPAGRTSTPHPCPRCRDPFLQEQGLFSNEIKVDVCPKCSGVFLDADELEKINAVLGRAVKSGKVARALPVGLQDLADRIHRPLAAAATLPLQTLPNLGLRSLGVFGVLSGLVFLAFFFLAEVARWQPHTAAAMALGFLFLQYLLSPLLMDWTLRWTMSLRWVDFTELPPALQQFVSRVCAEENVKIPRFGIINDGTPNAFTYGHTPNNARIVVTRGLMEILTEGELNAVVAHELGHAVHWDIAVMTLAAAVPILLYYLFRVLWNLAAKASSSRGKDSAKGAAPLYVAALAAYLIYLVSEFIVLYLSRVREFWADRFAGEKTRNPNELAMSLVKIAYGLAGGEEKKGKQPERTGRLDTVQSLSIFERKGALALAAMSLSQGNKLSLSSVVAAMQWDLWNPWAGYYEIQSTHPLPAKRIAALSHQSMTYGKMPLVEFNREKPESYWDEFLVDVLMTFLPALSVLAGLGALWAAGLLFETDKLRLFMQLLFLFGFGSFLKTLFSYRFDFFPDLRVADLLKNVKVSRVRGVPCRLHGKIIGRGVPGLIWSEDLVLQDDSGYIFLDYRQPLGLWELLFGLFRAGGLVGQTVTADGWYRRGPVPYVELHRLILNNGDTKTCYVYAVKWTVSVLLMVLGAALSVAAFLG